jgi:cyclic pyranopterin phosphate synthase
MIDVGAKPSTQRVAVATGFIRTGADTFRRLRDATLPKGDPLRLAEVAGVLAAKRTADLIPLCHPLGLDQAALAFRLDPELPGVNVFAKASTSARTGVEMEALTAATVALLTIWDLAKQVQPDLEIGGVRLLIKQGGKSGRFVHPDGLPALPEGFDEADAANAEQASGLFESTAGEPS